MFDAQYLEIIIFSAFTVGLYVVVPVALFRFGRRLLRALEQRSAAPEHASVLADRVAALEEQVEELSRENQRLTEQQQFATELLSSRVRP
jgi:hypothetical protein